MTGVQPQFDLESAMIESPGREVLQRLQVTAALDWSTIANT
jgi:hypothetical protein